MKTFAMVSALMPAAAVEKMRRYGTRPSYFVPWTGGLGPKKNAKAALTRIYQSVDIGTMHS